MPSDSRVALLGAFARGKSVDFRDWPNVATHLLVLGYDGEALRQLAGLDLGPFNAWDTDRLVPAVLEELDAPVMDDEHALRIVAGAVARLADIGRLSDTSAARMLAQIHVANGYPHEPAALGEVYYAEEFLDCDCHDPTLDLREALAELQSAVPAELDLALLAQLLGLRNAT